jgi:hypothetical protein
VSNVGPKLRMTASSIDDHHRLLARTGGRGVVRVLRSLDETAVVSSLPRTPSSWPQCLSHDGAVTPATKGIPTTVNMLSGEDSSVVL